MNLKEHKKQALKNEAFRKEYEKYDLVLEIRKMIVEARVMKGLTQSELAKLIGTKQSSVARLENGYKLPNLSFLEKIAKALGTDLSVKFKSKEIKQNITYVVVVLSPNLSVPEVSATTNSAMVEYLNKMPSKRHLTKV